MGLLNAPLFKCKYQFSGFRYSFKAQKELIQDTLLQFSNIKHPLFINFHLIFLHLKAARVHLIVPLFDFYRIFFCSSALELKFSSADINISIILTMQYVIFFQIFLFHWKTDFFRVHLIVPFLVMSKFQNRIFLLIFKKMLYDPPGRLSYTIFFKLAQK